MWRYSKKNAKSVFSVAIGLLALAPVLPTFTKPARLNTDHVPSVEIITLTFNTPWPDPITMPYIQPVVDSAMEYLRDTYSTIFNVSHSYVVDRNLSSCPLLQGGAADILSRYALRGRTIPDATALISTGCDEGPAENELAREWDYLMLTSVAAVKSTANKLVSPTWITTTVTSMPNYLRMYLMIFEKYNWQSIFVILDTNTLPVFPALSDILYGVLDVSPQFSVTRAMVDSTGNSKVVDFKHVLRDLRRVSRICVFLGNARPLRDLLIQAAEQNMTNGEYVYIGLEVFRDPVFGLYSWKYDDGQDSVRVYMSNTTNNCSNGQVTENPIQIARDAFQSLLLIGMLDENIQSSKLKATVDNWPHLSRERYHLTDPYYHKANALHVGLYLSFVMFGTVLNETLSSGLLGFPTGRALAQRVFNRTFKTDAGSVYIDETGLRRVDLTVSVLNYTTGDFDIVVIQHGEGWRWEDVRPIYGAGKMTPLNEPVCGYTNNRCLETAFDPVVRAVVPSLLVCILLSVLIVIGLRRFGRRDTEDMDWWWLSPDELGRPTLSQYCTVFRDNQMYPIETDDEVHPIVSSFSGSKILEVLR